METCVSREILGAAHLSLHNEPSTVNKESKYHHQCKLSCSKNFFILSLLFRNININAIWVHGSVDYWIVHITFWRFLETLQVLWPSSFSPSLQQGEQNVHHCTSHDEKNLQQFKYYCTFLNHPLHPHHVWAILTSPLQNIIVILHEILKNCTKTVNWGAHRSKHWFNIPHERALIVRALYSTLNHNCCRVL